jgi:hypothetical protein
VESNGTVSAGRATWNFDIAPAPAFGSCHAADVRFYKPSDTPGQVIALLEDGSQRIVPEKKVAILGRAPSTVNLAPYADESWEIWSLSNAAACNMCPRWNVWFELHPMETGLKRWGKDYAEWLATDHGKPIYIGKPDAHIPHGIVFPWETMFAKFGRYFNNSISEMIAVALLEGATELAIYGVDMAQTDPAMHNGNPEYQHQRPSCEHMIGVAQAMLGRDKIYIPIESDLMKANLIYAFQGNDNPLARKNRARRKELSERQKEIAATINQKQAELNQITAQRQHEISELHKAYAKFEGALEDNDYWFTRVQA